MSAVPVLAAPMSYSVTVTADGDKWMHAPGTDFLFAYVESSWDQTLKVAVQQAFESALHMSTAIKTAVKDTSGQDVVNGLYLLDAPAMTKAMNSIDGMGETGAAKRHNSGEGTAASINTEFFTAVLAGIEGDVGPILEYLTDSMHTIQAQVGQSGSSEFFGTVVGMISVMPDLDVVVTTFEYAFTSAETREWFVHIESAADAEHKSYDYSYTQVKYNYAPAELHVHARQ